jgi:hypothetical protein
MCDKHPRYKGIRHPRTPCPFCYETYCFNGVVPHNYPTNIGEYLTSQAKGVEQDGISVTYAPMSYYDYYMQKPCPYGFKLENTDCEKKHCKLECQPYNQYLMGSPEELAEEKQFIEEQAKLGIIINPQKWRVGKMFYKDR